MADQEIIEIEIRCANATRGPWKSMIEDSDHESGDNFIMISIEDGDDIWSEKRGEDIYLTGATSADQDSIAHARQDIPKLIAEIKKLKELLNK